MRHLERYISLMIIALLPILNCSKDDKNPAGPINTSNIIPLTAGNNWELETETGFPMSISVLEQVETEFNNEPVDAFSLSTYGGRIYNFYQNSTGLYMDENYNNNFKLFLKYPVNLGDTYDNLFEPSGYVRCISTNDTLSTPAGDFECIVYKFYASTTSNDSHLIIYAKPDIGFIGWLKDSEKEWERFFFLLKSYHVS